MTRVIQEMYKTKFIVSLICFGLSTAIHANKCLDNFSSHMYVRSDGYIDVLLNSCELKNEDVQNLISHVKSQLRSINTLSLVYNQIADDGAIALANFLNERNVLSANNEVYIAYNSIGDEGAKAFAQIKTLYNLNISFNEIGVIGAAEFAKNTSLNLLCLDYNKIGDLGAILLAGNQAIANLYVDGNAITDVGAISLAKNSHFSVLSIKDNMLTDTSAFVLSRQNYWLLDVSNNKIGSDGINALEKAEASHSIHFLLHNNNPGDE